MSAMSDLDQRIQELEALGFDACGPLDTGGIRVGCTQCEALVIQGTPCHETGYEGYVAMVVVTNQNQPTLETADRTGEVLHIRAAVWPQLFNVPVPPKGLAFIDTEAAAKIKAMVGES